MTSADCLLVGFNEVDFDRFARQQKQFEHTSGAYSELKTNSVMIGSRRVTYMDLLNIVLEQATGRRHELNPFEMPSLAVAYLASYLCRRGFQVEIVNFFNKETDRFSALLEESPRCVAITTTYYVSDEPIRELVTFVRNINPDVPIIVGGPRVFNICTGKPERTQNLIFRSIGADIYIHESQGEQTLADIVSLLRKGNRAELASVPNLVHQVTDAGGRVSMRRTERRIENNSLDDNAVDWSYFDRSFYTPTTYLRTSRSCSFACAFCNYPAMAGPLSLSDLSTVQRELRFMSDSGVRNVIFVDDTFNVPLPRFKKLMRGMIDDKLDMSWVSFFRCSNADDEAFDLMAEAGCLAVFLGIESGDPSILKNMNKFAKVERYRYGIERLRERHILTLASLVLGFPGEKPETIAKTLTFVNETRPDFYNVQLYFHDTLAPIETQRDRYAIEGSGYAWSHSTMDWKEAAAWKDYFIAHVEGPALLPLYGLSIWCLHYLLDHGLELEQVRRFAESATGLLTKGLEDRGVIADADIAAMAENFRPTTHWLPT